MPVRRTPGALLVSLVALGCATPVEPPSLEQLMQREVDLPKAEPFAPADGSFRAEAAGRLEADLEKLESAWYGEFDIGTDIAVVCLFFEDEGDPSSLLNALSQAFFEELGKSVEVDERRLMSVDAGAVGSTPYLAIDWLAVIDGAGSQVKLKYANKGARGIYCLHAETGFAGAFEVLFRGLVETYAVPGVAPAEALFEELTLIRAGAMTVGFQSTRMVEDSDGDILIAIAGSQLIPAGPAEVATIDEYFEEWSRPDGSLINAFATSSDGQTTTQLALAPSDEAWSVTGEMQGKTIEATFETEGPLLSVRGEYRLLQRVVEKPRGEEVAYQRWLSVNPVVSTAHVARSLGDSRVAVDAGPLGLEAEVDESGLKSGKVRIGRLELDLERVYVDGQP